MNRIKELREKLGIDQKSLAIDMKVSQPTISDWENGRKQPSSKSTARLADYFGVSIDYLLCRDKDSITPITGFAEFPVIGTITAGYNGVAVEDYTGEVELIPLSELKGHSEEDYFVLRVKGDSMYPQFLDGDRVLVYRCTSVDSGSIAVVIYNGEEATLKKVNYIYGEDWLELIPINPEYKTKRIEKHDLELCRVLGKVVKLIRDI